MFLRIIRNDIVRSKLITVTTTIFVAATAMLVALSAILIVHLTDAIDALMKQAKTPHSSKCILVIWIQYGLLISRSKAAM